MHAHGVLGNPPAMNDWRQNPRDRATTLYKRRLKLRKKSRGARSRADQLGAIGKADRSARVVGAGSKAVAPPATTVAVVAMLALVRTKSRRAADRPGKLGRQDTRQGRRLRGQWERWRQWQRWRRGQKRRWQEIEGEEKAEMLLGLIQGTDTGQDQQLLESRADSTEVDSDLDIRRRPLVPRNKREKVPLGLQDSQGTVRGRQVLEPVVLQQVGGLEGALAIREKPLLEG